MWWRLRRWSLAGKISKKIKAYGLTLSSYRSKYPQNRRAKPLVLKKLIFYIKTLAHKATYQLKSDTKLLLVRNAGAKTETKCPIVRIKKFIYFIWISNNKLFLWKLYDVCNIFHNKCDWHVLNTDPYKE